MLELPKSTPRYVVDQVRSLEGDLDRALKSVDRLTLARAHNGETLEIVIEALRRMADGRESDPALLAWRIVHQWDEDGTIHIE